MYNFITNRFGNRSYIILLILIVLVGFMLRIYKLGYQSLWIDELISILISSLNLNEIFGAVRMDINAPLFYYLLHFWMDLGKSELYLRFLSLILGLLSIPLIYLLADKLYGKAVGLLSAFLLSISPFHIWYSQEVRVYTLNLFLSLISIWFFFKILQNGKLSYLGFIISCSLSMYAHYSAFFILFITNWFLIIMWYKKKYLFTKMNWIVSQLIIIILSIPVFEILLFQILNTFNQQGFIFLEELNYKVILRLFYDLIFWRAPFPINIKILLLIPIAVSFFLGIWPNQKKLKKNDGKNANILEGKTFFLLCYSILPILCCYIFGQIVDKVFMYDARFFITFIPAYYIIIAKGICDFNSNSVKYFLFLCIIFPMIFSIHSIYICKFPNAKPDMKNVVNYIKHNYREKDIVIVHHSFFKMVFDYYNTDNFIAEGVLNTFDPHKGFWPDAWIPVSEEYLPIFKSQLKGYSRMWLIITPWHNNKWRDPNAIIQKYCDLNFKKVDQKSLGEGSNEYLMNLYDLIE